MVVADGAVVVVVDEELLVGEFEERPWRSEDVSADPETLAETVLTFVPTDGVSEF
jgi:hypothetical protein